MYRCDFLPRLTAAICLAACAAASAQVHRNFPATALRGELVIGQSPEVSVNGQAARLAPGSRIKGETNLLMQPASLAGQKLTVHYTVEPTGLVMDVWVLNTAELANKPWPRSASEAAAWRFDQASQTWSKP